MPVTLLWAVRSRLVDTFKTATGLTDVFDGPRPRGSAPAVFLLVGSDGGETGVGDGVFEDAVAATQVPSHMGNDWKDEDGTILCSLWTWSGSTDFAALRSAATSYLDECAAAIRSDPTLGGLLATGGRSHLSGLSSRESQTKQGAVLRVTFAIAYSALITP